MPKAKKSEFEYCHSLFICNQNFDAIYSFDNKIGTTTKLLMHKMIAISALLQ
jgi:hypothetical protein